MPTFLFAYRLPKDYKIGSPEQVAAWNAWFEQLGSHLVARGNPVVDRRTLGAGPSATVLGGYSLVTAEDLDAAAVLAKGSPAVSAGLGVEVGELLELNRSA